MLGFIRPRNEATSASVSERFIFSAIRLSWSGVGSETGMVACLTLAELAGAAGRPGRGRRRGEPGVEVTGGEVAGAHLAQLRLDVSADVADVGLAPGVEAAPGGRIERARDLPSQNYLLPLALHVGIRGGDRGDQGLAVGVQRLAVEVRGAGNLADLAEAHPHHPT